MVLDIDGTLVDTNYQHALAWHRALRAHGHIVQVWEIHRHIGMGGDQIVAALAGDEAEQEQGEEIRAAEGDAYGELIGEVEPMDGARALIEDLKGDGARAILASSAKEEEVDRYLDLLDARDLVDGWTTAADVERTKPHPDLVHAALEKAGGEGPAVMVGDSTWDVKAADGGRHPDPRGPQRRLLRGRAARGRRRRGGRVDRRAAQGTPAAGRAGVLEPISRPVNA